MSGPPSSPTSPVRRRNAPIHGFLAPPRPKQRPINQMTLRELQDLHKFNAKILSSPNASTSTYVNRIQTEQAAVESRLLELDGMETINTGLRRTALRGEGDMVVDPPPEPTTSRAIEAKKKALAQFGKNNHTSIVAGSMTMQEAMDLERQAHLQDQARQNRILEKKKRLGQPIHGEVLSRKEREAMIWAFMNHKPSESDLEDDEDDEEDEDPSTWFEDDQDDGRKGQLIVEPDTEDFSDIIRIDENKMRYSTFYEPHDEGD